MLILCLYKLLVVRVDNLIIVFSYLINQEK